MATIYISMENRKQLEEYKKRNTYPSMNYAIRELIKLGKRAELNDLFNPLTEETVRKLMKEVIEEERRRQ